MVVISLPLLLQICLSLVALVSLLMLFGALAIAWFSIHPPKFKNRHSPADFAATYEEIEFNSADGTSLQGWYVPSIGADCTLILAHGMSANRSQMIPWASWLWRARYSILLFDFRALGASAGDICTMGLREPEDISAAVGYLQSRNDWVPQRVGVFGFSMGGTSAMIAAASDERIHFVISHGAYADLDRAIYQRCRKHFGPLAPPVEMLARKFGQRWFPVAAEDISALRVMKELSPRPLLLLNGAHDNIVKPKNALDLRNNYDSAELWILPNSAHAYPAMQDEAEYRGRVLTFIESSLCVDSFE